MAPRAAAARVSFSRGREAMLAPGVAARPPLRVLGTGVTLLETIRQRAEEDLGFPIRFEVLDGVSAQQKAVTRPGDYDVYDQWFHSVELMWAAGAAQPIHTGRIALWNEVNDLAKIGRLKPQARIGQGDAPVNRLYVQPDETLHSRAGELISMLPVVHNVDSFGYNADLVEDGAGAGSESWAWLFDPRWKGRVALVNDPAIGLMDAALGAQAAGLASFRDIGNMSLKEIDLLISLLIERKRAGHFRKFWGSIADAERLMAERKVVIESLWSPTVAALRGRGLSVRNAAPHEGYRAWHGGMCISSRARGAALDQAYQYLNWWLSGWPGALMARQGYYISVPGRVRKYLSPAEWAYWYLGEAAQADLSGPDGAVVVRAGERRDGGSYWERFSNIAVWNSSMDEHNYLVRRWNELLRA